MMYCKRAALLALPIFIFCYNPSSAAAQTFRYMDQAGNILYADSVSLIPPQYRNQVLKPTPQPTYKPGFKPKTPTDSTLRKKKNPPKKKKDRRKPIPGNSAPYTDNF